MVPTDVCEKKFIIIRPKWIIALGELWKHCTEKNGVDTFGYYSAESERIWMKSEELWAHCWGLAQADFGLNPRRKAAKKFLSGK